MRRIFAIITAIALIFTLSGCKKEEEKSEIPNNYVNPPFFTVRDEATGGELFLLGSMHVGLPNTIYPDIVYSSLDECETVACEIDLLALDNNRDEVNEAVKMFECGSAAEYMGEDYAEIKSYFKSHGINADNLDKYMPVMWSITLSQKAAIDGGYDSKYGTDREILTLAKKKGKKIVELETVTEQYKINAGESPALQMFSLKNAVSLPYSQLIAQNSALYLAWSTGNTAVIEKMLSSSSVPEELSEDYSSYFYEMYGKRQEKMAEYAVNALKNGEKVFIVVGAAHYFAEPDILDFLAKAGYSPKTFGNQIAA